MVISRCVLTHSSAHTHTRIHCSFQHYNILNPKNFGIISFLKSFVHVCVPACDCDPRGIATQQCNKMTGECVCVEGVAGRRCDSCGRGYVGTFPDCKACHLCFREWDVNVGELTNHTQRLVDTVEEIKETGVATPYKDIISSLDDETRQLRQILEDDKVQQTLTHMQRTLQQAKCVLHIHTHITPLFSFYILSSYIYNRKRNCY